MRKVNRERCDTGVLSGDVESEDPPSSLARRQIASVPIFLDLVDRFRVVVSGKYAELCTVRTLRYKLA